MKTKRIEKRSGFEGNEEKTRVCRHPEHQPPTHLYIPSGRSYRHVCPGCGNEIVLKSPEITC